MKPRKATYLGHRWLGLLVSLQLLAWSSGGFLFSVLPLALVRGERDIAAAPYEPMTPGAVELLPEPVRGRVAALREGWPDLAIVSLQDRGLGAAWEIRDIHGELIERLDGASGAPLPMLTPDEARTIAARDFAHPIGAARATLIDADPPMEYRKGRLPAYRVEAEHASRAHLYVDARTGELTARRNRVWRVFDFFWMLHTMDYKGRDNFNHLLLTAFSVLAILTASSGLALWGWRAVSRSPLAGKGAGGAQT